MKTCRRISKSGVRKIQKIVARGYRPARRRVRSLRFDSVREGGAL